VLLYGTNRWVLKSHVGGWFIHDYLNDVLCLPLFLPIILKVQAALGIRRHDGVPTALEVLHNWIVFSVVFELVLPRLSMFASTADPWDSLAYLLGGFAAYAYWHSPCRVCARNPHGVSICSHMHNQIDTVKLRLIVSLALSFAASMLSGCCASPQASAQDDGSAKALVGAWRSKVQFSSGSFAEVKDLEFLYVFNDGGTLTESSNYDGSPPVPPAYGVWREVAPGQFEAKYIFYATKPPARFEDITGGGGWSPAGRGELSERITLSGDGQSFTSTIQYDPFDAAGKSAPGGGRAEGRGSRVRF